MSKDGKDVWDTVMDNYPTVAAMGVGAVGGRAAGRALKRLRDPVANRHVARAKKWRKSALDAARAETNPVTRRHLRTSAQVEKNVIEGHLGNSGRLGAVVGAVGGGELFRRTRRK